MTRYTIQQLTDLASIRDDARRDAADTTLGRRERRCAEQAVTEATAAMVALARR